MINPHPHVLHLFDYAQEAGEGRGSEDIFLFNSFWIKNGINQNGSQKFSGREI